MNETYIDIIWVKGPLVYQSHRSIIITIFIIVLLLSGYKISEYHMQPMYKKHSNFPFLRSTDWVHFFLEQVEGHVERNNGIFEINIALFGIP